MKTRIQATAGAEGKGKRRRYQIHIVAEPAVLSLEDLTRREVKYLQDLLTLMLEEN